jgi:predicted RecB family endonuclease
MSATVVCLDSRRRNREPSCGCPRHPLEALVARALAQVAGTEGELLVDRRVVVHLVDDLTRTVEAALERASGGEVR